MSAPAEARGERRGRGLRAALGAGLLAAAGVVVCVLLAGLGPAGQVGLVGSIGASTTLLLGAPRSPLATPYRALVGSVLSAAIGVAAQRVLGPTDVAAILAVSAALAAMSAFDAVHPPGGAAALLAVVGGPEVAQLGFGFALHPIGTSTAVLLVLGRCSHPRENPAEAREP